MRVLKDLPEGIKVNVLADVARAGGRVVEEGAKFLAPVDEGGLQESITTVVRKYPRDQRAVAVTGPEKRFRKGNRQPAKYAHLPEFGFIHTSGKHVPATPFMRPAAMTAETMAVEPMAQAAAKGIDRELKKLLPKTK